MKYNVGDRVRIKSLDWYNENKDKYGQVFGLGAACFYRDMSCYCGSVLTIDKAFDKGCYRMKEDYSQWIFTDGMIEGLVEEENNPKFKKGDCVKCSDGSIGIIVTCDWSDSLNCYQYYVDYIGTLDAGYQPEKDLQPHTITTMNGKDIFEGAKWKHEFECPDGYIFKDENGNVINATKIVLEKKKKEYPKTYEECRKIMDIDTGFLLTSYDLDFWKGHLLTSLQKLLICRDAYWKLYGEENGLGKPWEPDWKDDTTHKFIIHTIKDKIHCGVSLVKNHLLAFPTAEMRDAFYDNFKEEIEFCKELL